MAEGVTPAVLWKLLNRCKQVKSVVYIPSSPLQKEIVSVITQFENIRAIEFVDCKDCLEEVRNQNTDVVIGEVHLHISPPPISNMISGQLYRYRSVSVLYMQDGIMDAQLLFYFSKYADISLVKCTFEVESNSELESLEFMNLCKFMYVEQPGRSASSRVGALLVVKAAESEKLEVLRVGLSEFSPVEAAALRWKAVNLRNLEIVSTGSYSASLQQLKYASIIANICHKCRTNLKRISLPSSILIKHFFTRLISSGLFFEQLQALQMTGLADTKMFLAPGNLVETLFYQEFLKLCPSISCLSLHSFTGSLVTLVLPFTLTELVLPWDNRLNLEKQKNDIVATLSVIPHLNSLSILGVEEVDTLLQESALLRLKPPVLDTTINSLREFHLKNVCIQGVNLYGCNLVKFSIQCCPLLEELNLPVDSLENVCIYDDYRSYIDRFISHFMMSKSKLQGIRLPCHVHIQLHSVVKQEPDARTEHRSTANDLFSVIKRVCEDTKNLDLIALKDNQMHLFEHNSGELLYPFTDFQADGQYSSGRSEVEIKTELARRKHVFEGLNRWKDCIIDVKSLHSVISSDCTIRFQSFDATYCESSFKVATNLNYFMKLNALSQLCQPSGLNLNHNPYAHNSASEEVDLNVPHIESHVKPIIYHSIPGSNLKNWNINSNPLVVVSVIEYAHNIYTLFYYD